MHVTAPLPYYIPTALDAIERSFKSIMKLCVKESLRKSSKMCYRKMNEGASTRRSCFRLYYLVQMFVGLVAVIFIRSVAKAIPYAKQGFFCHDDEIRFPNYPDTVDPDFMNFTFVLIAVILIPCVEYTLIRHLTHRRGHRLSRRQMSSPLHPGLYSVFYFLLCLLCNQFAISTVTALGKRTISRLRPNFLAVCQPNLKELCPPEMYRYVEDYICYGEYGEDQYFSFPSGHSALSTGFAIFLIFYLHKRCKLPEPACAVLQLTAALYAFFICLSRVRDHKHRLSDVAGGAVVGATVAMFLINFVVRGFRHARYDTEEIVKVETFFERDVVSPSAVLHERTRSKGLRRNPELMPLTSEYGSVCDSSVEDIIEKVNGAIEIASETNQG